MAESKSPDRRAASACLTDAVYSSLLVPQAAMKSARPAVKIGASFIPTPKDNVLPAQDRSRQDIKMLGVTATKALIVGDKSLKSRRIMRLVSHGPCRRPQRLGADLEKACRESEDVGGGDRRAGHGAVAVAACRVGIKDV